MRQTLKFNGVETEFSSSAATPILYKQVFKSDLLVQFAELSKKYKDEKKKKAEKKEKEVSEIDLEFLDMVKKLTYIMRAEAVGGSLFNTLTYDGFIKWLMSLEPNAFDDGVFNAQIVALWNGNTKSFSESKNVTSQPQDRITAQSTY